MDGGARPSPAGLDARSQWTAARDHHRPAWTPGRGGEERTVPGHAGRALFGPLASSEPFAGPRPPEAFTRRTALCRRGTSEPLEGLQRRRAFTRGLRSVRPRLNHQAQAGPVEIDLVPFTQRPVSGRGRPASRAIGRKRRSSCESVRANVRRSRRPRRTPTPRRPRNCSSATRRNSGSIRPSLSASFTAASSGLPRRIVARSTSVSSGLVIGICGRVKHSAGHRPLKCSADPFSPRALGTPPASLSDALRAVPLSAPR